MSPGGWIHHCFSCQLPRSSVLGALGSCVRPREKKKKEIYYQIVKFGMKSPSHSFTTGNFSGCYGPTCNTSWQQYLSSLQFSLRALGPHLYTFSNIFLAQSLETIKRLGLHILKGRSWTDDKGRQWTFALDFSSLHLLQAATPTLSPSKITNVKSPFGGQRRDFPSYIGLQGRWNSCSPYNCPVWPVKSWMGNGSWLWITGN